MLAYTPDAVAITGAGGSIGSVLCERFIEAGARRLVLISLTESALYNVEKALRRKYGGACPPLEAHLGSCGDEVRMRRVLNGVSTVIHAAAHKHVPLCESNPSEAIRNNVFGTASLIDAARAAGVDRFCLVSSDKAVRPASVMGATKRLAELLIAAAGDGFFTVRFGNVMDSAGSVVPLWREQILAGGPLTITDRRCERYFMSIAQAVGLIYTVLSSTPRTGGGLYVLDMGLPRRLIDLASDLMRELGKEVPVVEIGLRAGEKLTEELHHGGTLLTTEMPGVFRVGDAAFGVDPERLALLRAVCEMDDATAARALLAELTAAVTADKAAA